MVGDHMGILGAVVLLFAGAAGGRGAPEGCFGPVLFGGASDFKWTACGSAGILHSEGRAVLPVR